MPPLLSVEEALRLVLAAVRPLPAETVDLAAARGRVLAADVLSDADHPPFRRSRVDGYAVRAADVAAGLTLRVIAEVPAGKAPGDRVGAGEAARIFTGAPVPDGADAVVKQEDCEASGESTPGDPRVPSHVRFRAGDVDGHIVPAGAECRRGAVVARAGDVVGAARTGVLASVGATRVEVRRRPRFRIVSTGDELVPADVVPGPGRIRNSNAPALAAAAVACGGDVVGTDWAGDEREALRAVLARALGCASEPSEPSATSADRGPAATPDVLLVTGGVSVGDFDLVPGILAELGVERVLHGVRLQPGKPLWFGVRATEAGGRTLVFGLPGNPVSALVNTALFVRPACFAMTASMRTANPGPPSSVVRLARGLPSGGARRRMIPATSRREGPVVLAEPVPFQGSGDVFGFSAAEGLLVLPENAPARLAGQEAEWIPLFGDEA